MGFNLGEATAVLSRTPGVLRALLGGLDDGWTRCDAGPGTFSPFDVVGHLIHGERTDWIPRLRIILEHGPSRPFEPFDRFAMLEESRGKTLVDLLDTLASLRAGNLVDLGGLGLTEARLDLRGTHPALGLVTARELVATWVAHDLGHMRQIVSTMARRYRDAVGPWVEFLSVLKQ